MTEKVGWYQFVYALSKSHYDLNSVVFITNVTAEDATCKEGEHDDTWRRADVLFAIRRRYVYVYFADQQRHIIARLFVILRWYRRRRNDSSGR